MNKPQIEELPLTKRRILANTYYVKIGRTLIPKDEVAYVRNFLSRWLNSQRNRERYSTGHDKSGAEKRKLGRLAGADQPGPAQTSSNNDPIVGGCSK